MLFHSIATENAIDRIPIPIKYFGYRISGKGFCDLLCCPLGSRVRGYVEMNNFASVVAEDHQNEQNVERGCRNSEKINRTLVHMVFQESPPSLRQL